MSTRSGPISKCEFSAKIGPLGYGVAHCHIHQCDVFFDESHCMIGMVAELHDRVTKIEEDLKWQMKSTS